MKISQILNRLDIFKGHGTSVIPPVKPPPTQAGFNPARLALFVGTILTLTLLLSVHLLPNKIDLHLGDTSPREIRATRSVIYADTTRTERLQEAASASVAPVYDMDEGAIRDARRAVNEWLDHIVTVRETAQTYEYPKLALQEALKLKPQFGSAFTPSQYVRLLTLAPAMFDKFRATVQRLSNDAMEREIRDLNPDSRPSSDLRRVRQVMAEAANEAFSSDLDSTVALTALDQALRPNRLLNRTKTQALRDAKRSETPLIYEKILLGDRIIGVGERVDQGHLDRFTALGLLNPRLELATGAALCVLSAAMALLVAVTIARTLPVLYADTRRLTLLSVIVLLSVLGLKVSGTLLGLQFSGGQLGYLGMMSVAAAGMLVSVLLSRNLAVLIAALLSVQSGLIMNHEIRFTVMTLMGSLIGISAVGGARSKVNLPGVTLILATSNVGLVWLLGLLFSDSLPELLTGSVWAVGSAAFATFLFWLGVLALEKPFGILTHNALLELSASDRPLLQQLCAIAPGTFAHSMLVGTLAEAGATAIGADGMLARVGGYYHDIGKMKRPDFFIENQRNDNVHGRLSPSLSALIITAHVRDGLDTSRENHLPREIRDIIAQHHGTTLIRYFYDKALTDCGGIEEAPAGLEERFRYPGPRPQSHEAAIVMLADSVEAAARCLDKPTPEKLEAKIVDIVRDKIEDGQLDECELTFRDIRKVSDAFLHVLTAMMHGRIDYPEMHRSGTGKPMEVVRPDLRPATSSSPVTFLELPQEAIAIEQTPLYSVLTPTTKPETSHPFSVDAMEMEYPDILTSLMSDSTSDPHSDHNPFPEEIRYEPLRAEPADAPGETDLNEKSHQEPSAKRRTRRSRGERPAR